MFNIGDAIYQFVVITFLIGVIIATFVLIRTLFLKRSKSAAIEEKLDRIIQLLEEDRKQG